MTDLAPSQQNVLDALRAARGPACKYDLVRWMQASGRWAGSDSVPKRVCELAEAGHTIVKSWCDWHGHRARVYELVEVPTQLDWSALLEGADSGHW